MATTTPAAHPARLAGPPRRVTDVYDLTEPGRYPGDLIELIQTRRRELGGIYYRELADRAGMTLGPGGVDVPRIGHSTMHDLATIPLAYGNRLPSIDKMMAVADALSARDLTVTLPMVIGACAASVGYEIVPREPGGTEYVVREFPRRRPSVDALRDPFGAVPAPR